MLFNFLNLINFQNLEMLSAMKLVIRLKAAGVH